MPTYSYRCSDCSTAFDIQQAFTDDSLTVCPSCEGRLRKVFSAVGVTFNGSGFYRTDSRAGASKTSDGGSSSADSGSSTSGSSMTSSTSDSGSSAKPSTTPTPAKAATAS